MVNTTLPAAFDDFIGEIDQDADVRVHTDAYLYGEGETVKATPEEVAYRMMRQERNPNFLSDHCDHRYFLTMAIFHSGVCFDLDIEIPPKIDFGYFLGLL